MLQKRVVHACGWLVTMRVWYTACMTVSEQVRADMVAAMKAREEVRLSVLRGLLTMFMQELTATKRTPQDVLSDAEALDVIRRALKQRKDAAEQFRAGGRPELAEKEDAEAVYIKHYLPAQLSAEEIDKVVRAKKEQLGVTDKTGMGKLMGAVMQELKGNADGGVVKEVVERLFAGD